MDVVLVVGFTAFFLALFESLIAILANFVNPVAVNTVFALSLSALGMYLSGGYNPSEFALRTLACGFFARVLILLVERLAVYRPVTVTPTGQ